MLYDLEGCAAAANESAQNLLGYSPQEFVGYLIPLARCATKISRASNSRCTPRRAGGTDHFDTSAKHRDGTVIPLECYVFPARFNRAIVGVFTQARDIVALRSAESSLTINQEKFRSLFEYHPDGIMELKATGAISRVNVALEGETGFFGEQIVGKPWTELIAPERRDAAAGALDGAMRGEAIEDDSLLLDRLGNRLDVQLKLVPLHVGTRSPARTRSLKTLPHKKPRSARSRRRASGCAALLMVAASRDESLEDQIDAALSLGVELFGWDIGYVTQYQARPRADSRGVRRGDHHQRHDLSGARLVRVSRHRPSRTVFCPGHGRAGTP